MPDTEHRTRHGDMAGFLSDPEHAGQEAMRYWCDKRWLRRGVATAGLLMLLSGCVHAPPESLASNLAESPWARTGTQTDNGGASSPWMHQTFPGKRATQYRYERKNGRDAVLVRAVSSASMLRQTVRIEPERLGQLRFSWMVPALISAADLAQRDTDDSPVRVVLAFEGDRARFSARDAALSELSEVLTGEPLPYATLMYVWSNRRAPGSVIINPRTSRIRKLVMESGPEHLLQWLDYERDVRADFVKAFGEAPGALLAIGIMTDTDNTRSEAQAWYGPVRHVAIHGTRRNAKAD
jgi:hypothetical protein